MPDANSLLLFMAATIALNVTPGPDMLYVIARSIGQGRAAGIASALGITAGCFVHIFAVTFGLASLMMAVPTAYEIVKFAGATYLIYLGVRTLTTRQSKKAETPIKEASLRTIFLQGVVTNVLNPKVALFFLAFLPQFVSRGSNVASQIIFLGVLFNTSGTIVNVIVALVASYTGIQFKNRIGNSSMFRWLTGGIFIGLGVRLALLERK
ncbi:MAG TPA: LysE family translocator [Nitrososphaera sp.]|nr:LysE family translocator [Nitrososphaera sp.]